MHFGHIGISHIGKTQQIFHWTGDGDSKGLLHAVASLCGSGRNQLREATRIVSCAMCVASNKVMNPHTERVQFPMRVYQAAFSAVGFSSNPYLRDGLVVQDPLRIGQLDTVFVEALQDIFEKVAFD